MNDYYDGSAYDQETVRFFDVAHEGAQVRAVAAAVADLARLRGGTPRSVVVVTSDQTALASAQYVARIRSPLRWLLVVTDALPTFVGPLDVVIVVGDKSDDVTMLRDVTTAAGRGAVTVLAGPPVPELIDDAPRDTIVIPSLPHSAGASPARTIMTVCTVLDVLEEDDRLIAQRLHTIADELDEEATGLSPERDETVNPARQLRAYVDNSAVLHTGVDTHGEAVAELVATLFSLRGLPSGYVAGPELAAATADHASPVDSLFHDPFLDGPATMLTLKIVVWGAEETEVSNALAVPAPASAAGIAGQAQRLLVRGLAATALNPPE